MIPKIKIEEMIACIQHCGMKDDVAVDYAMEFLADCNPYQEFNQRYGVGHIEPTRENLLKAGELMSEELREFYQELFHGVVIDVKLSGPVENINLHNVAKEMTDGRYITGERMTAFGFDVPALDAEVHRSNMSKTVPAHHVDFELDAAQERYPNIRATVGRDGYAVLRCGDTGKVVKPTTTSPANITDRMISYDDPNRN